MVTCVDRKVQIVFSAGMADYHRNASAITMTIGRCTHNITAAVYLNISLPVLQPCQHTSVCHVHSHVFQLETIAILRTCTLAYSGVLNKWESYVPAQFFDRMKTLFNKMMKPTLANMGEG